jgi:hypothetical protein
VTLSISPNTGSLNTAGTRSISQSTTAGEYIFSGLRILSSGIQTLVASSTGMADISTASMDIKNYVHAMEITSSTTTPTVNFDFTITVTLKGEDQTNYVLGCTVTITDSLTPTTLGGSISETTATGVAVFTSFFKSIGAKTITASCSETETGQAMTITRNFDVQKLRLVFTTFNPVFSI